MNIDQILQIKCYLRKSFKNKRVINIIMKYFMTEEEEEILRMAKEVKTINRMINSCNYWENLKSCHKL